jgi:hypothetical protein
VLGVCSINQNGWPPFSPRIRSCMNAIQAGEASSGG